MSSALLFPIFVAGILPFLFTGIAKAGAFGPQENHRTRDWQSELEGWRKRAYWAHQNSFEAFPLFLLAGIAAYTRIPDNQNALIVAWAFVGLRLLYGFCYIKNLASLRSIVWFAALGCNAALFLIAVL